MRVTRLAAWVIATVLLAGQGRGHVIRRSALVDGSRPSSWNTLETGKVLKDFKDSLEDLSQEGEQPARDKDVLNYGDTDEARDVDREFLSEEGMPSLEEVGSYRDSLDENLDNRRDFNGEDASKDSEEEEILEAAEVDKDNIDVESNEDPFEENVPQEGTDNGEFKVTSEDTKDEYSEGDVQTGVHASGEENGATDFGGEEEHHAGVTAREEGTESSEKDEDFQDNLDDVVLNSGDKLDDATETVEYHTEGQVDSSARGDRIDHDVGVVDGERSGDDVGEDESQVERNMDEGISKPEGRSQLSNEDGVLDTGNKPNVDNENLDIPEKRISIMEAEGSIKDEITDESVEDDQADYGRSTHDEDGKRNVEVEEESQVEKGMDEEATGSRAMDMNFEENPAEFSETEGQGKSGDGLEVTDRGGKQEKDSDGGSVVGRSEDIFQEEELAHEGKNEAEEEGDLDTVGEKGEEPQDEGQNEGETGDEFDTEGEMGEEGEGSGESGELPVSEPNAKLSAESDDYQTETEATAREVPDAESVSREEEPNGFVSREDVNPSVFVAGDGDDMVMTETVKTMSVAPWEPEGTWTPLLDTLTMDPFSEGGEGEEAAAKVFAKRDVQAAEGKALDEEAAESSGGRPGPNMADGTDELVGLRENGGIGNGLVNSLDGEAEGEISRERPVTEGMDTRGIGEEGLKFPYDVLDNLGILEAVSKGNWTGINSQLKGAFNDAGNEMNEREGDLPKPTVGKTDHPLGDAVEKNVFRITGLGERDGGYSEVMLVPGDMVEVVKVSPGSQEREEGGRRRDRREPNVYVYEYPLSNVGPPNPRSALPPGYLGEEVRLLENNGNAVDIFPLSSALPRDPPDLTRRPDTLVLYDGPTNTQPWSVYPDPPQAASSLPLIQEASRPSKRVQTVRAKSSSESSWATRESRLRYVGRNLGQPGNLALLPQDFTDSNKTGEPTPLPSPVWLDSPSLRFAYPQEPTLIPSDHINSVFAPPTADWSDPASQFTNYFTPTIVSPLRFTQPMKPLNPNKFAAPMKPLQPVRVLPLNLQPISPLQFGAPMNMYPSNQPPLTSYPTSTYQIYPFQSPGY